MKIVIANGEWRRLSKVTGLELTLTRRDATRTELLSPQAQWNLSNVDDGEPWPQGRE